MDFGELQEDQAPPSTRQLNVDPDPDELNMKLADVVATVPDGPEAIDVSGGGVSPDGETTSLSFLRGGSAFDGSGEAQNGRQSQIGRVRRHGSLI